VTENSYTFDYDAVRTDIRARYPDFVAVYDEVEAYARGIQHQIEVQRNHLQHLLVASIFVRTLSNTAAAIVVAERGFDVQCRILLRSAMESLFSLVAIAKNPELAETFVAADERERKRMLHKSRKWSGADLKEQADVHATEELLREIERNIEEADAKLMSTEQWSIAAGLHDWCLTAYAVFSASVHGNVRDLERQLVLTENREIEAIRNEPAVEGVDNLYLTASEVLINAVEQLLLVFNIDTRPFCSEAAEKLRSIAKRG
jgi:hypothetical protein